MKKLKLREKRTLVLGVIAIFAIFLAWYFLLWDNSLWNRWQNLKSRVAAREGVLRKMTRLGREYVKLRGQVDEVVFQMADKKKGLAVKGFLEELIGEKAPGADLKRMKTRTEAVHGLYRETSVSVKLGRVTLPELVNFLWSVEHSGQALKIKELRIDIDRKLPDYLDVEFTVVSATTL